MRQLKKLGLVLIAAAALTSLAGSSAEATVLCTSTDTPGCAHTYPVGTKIDISASSKIGFVFGATQYAECTGNTIEGQTTSASAESIKLKLEKLTWEGCSPTVDTLALGELAIQWIKGTHSATVKATGTQWTMTVSGVSCTYGFAENTYLGTLITREQPTLRLEAPAKKISGTNLCPAEMIMFGQLAVVSPHALYVVGEEGPAYQEGILCKSTTTPCANAYGKGTTVDADVSGSAIFESGGTALVTCTGGTLKGKTENAGSNTEAVRVPLETVSWSGCSKTTSTVVKGSLELQRIEGTENGTVIGKNTQITLGILGTSCTYGFGEASDLGTLTGKESPVIDINTELPKTAGGATCPASVRWVAEYKLTELSPLYLEGTEEGVLCETTTTPCSSPYGRDTAFDVNMSLWLKAGETTLASCSGGTLRGNIPTLGGESEAFAVAVEELTWVSCNTFTKTLTLGELEVERIAGTEDGTVSAKGTEVTARWEVFDCIYGFTAWTDIGTLTGGSEPTVNINATLTRTGGSLFCPKTATWEGSYELINPKPLYLEPV